MRRLTVLLILFIAAFCGCKKESTPERLILAYRIVRAERNVLRPQYISVYETDLISPKLEAYEKESLAAGPESINIVPVPLVEICSNKKEILLEDLLSNQSKVGWELADTLEGDKTSIVFIFKRYAPSRIQRSPSTSTAPWYNYRTHR